ncbi:hypothetical protein QFC21_005940 [Naganishia friedmannii]|uniref:Uncharacterized protein n=1 Tax=Naganishia friedmannii TaxID=89922 RepID=A0ACC2V5T8_9TREE|nr:hypothetical protein QFC21_005940 [Naganishia friedmannii]
MAATPESTTSSTRASHDDASRLTAILQSTAKLTLLEKDLNLITRVLSPLYSHGRHGKNDRSRALTFLVLSRVTTTQTQAQDPSPLLSRYILSHLQETSIPRLLGGISLLDALVQLHTSPSAGAQENGESVTRKVLGTDGVLESLTEVLDTQVFTVEEDDSEAHDEENADERKHTSIDVEQQRSLLDHSLAQLFSSIANIPTYRSFLVTRVRPWLEMHLAPSSPSTKPDAESARIEAQTTVLCAVTLTKLAKAAIVDPALEGQDQEGGAGVTGGSKDAAARAGDELEQLTNMLKTVIITASPGKSPSTSSSPTTRSDAESITSALEGLAYTSSQPELKSVLANDAQFLQALVGIAKSLPASTSRAKTSGLSASYSVDMTAGNASQSANGNQAAAYGLATIMYNLFARRLVLSQEQKQLEALKKMANAGATTAKKTMGQAVGSANQVEDEAMSEDAVHARVQKGIKNGAVEAITALAKMDSIKVKQVVGGVLLALVHERQDRLEVVKQGGCKTLRSVISALLDLPVAEHDKAEWSAIGKDSLSALQALAKLVITSPPAQLFGTETTTAAMDTVRPMALLLLHPESSLLQRFEAMMALTNLASVDPAVGQRICMYKSGYRPKGAAVGGAGDSAATAASGNNEVLQAVESQMLEDHRMVRRAAVELVCNLMTSDESFARYSGDFIPDYNPSITTAEQARKASTPRLHILLALTDVRDLPTCLAASGALAMLTQSETACGILLVLGGDSTKVWEKIGGLLAPLKAENDAAGNDVDFDEEEEDDIEEISTLPPNHGLVHRGLTITLNLFQHIQKSPPYEKAKAFKNADTCGLTSHLINLLAIWTDKNLLAAKEVTPPPREVVDLGIECLRVLKANGIQLVV